MKKIIYLLILLFVVSCTTKENKPDPVSKYKDGDYIFFTITGENKPDTLLGQINMGLLGEPVLFDDSTFLYRITYKANGEYKKDWFKSKSIIGKYE